MARKKAVKEESVPTDTRVSDYVGTGTSAKINNVELVGSRDLVTILPEDGIWKGERKTVRSVEGAIVRIRPPATATDEEVERVRAEFAGKKAARVVVMPRPRPELIPAAVAKEAPRAAGARDAVLALVAESNSKDREALAQLCEEIMAEVGL